MDRHRGHDLEFSLVGDAQLKPSLELGLIHAGENLSGVTVLQVKAHDPSKKGYRYI